LLSASRPHEIDSHDYKDELDEQVEGIERMMDAGVRIVFGGDLARFDQARYS